MIHSQLYGRTSFSNPLVPPLFCIVLIRKVFVAVAFLANPMPPPTELFSAFSILKTIQPVSNAFPSSS
jgi:hypothetical protein